MLQNLKYENDRTYYWQPVSVLVVVSAVVVAVVVVDPAKKYLRDCNMHIILR